MSDCRFVSVYLDQNLAKSLDYAVPEKWQREIQVGMRVEVPLRNSTVKATVAALKQASSFPNVKPILALLSPQGELSPAQWKLAEWMARYYMAPLQKVLRCFIPPHVRREVKEKKQIWLSLKKTDRETIAAIESLRSPFPAQAAVLESLLQAKKGKFLSEILKELQISSSPIETLIRNQWIAKESLHSKEDLLMEEEFFPTFAKTLHPEQSACLEKIVASLAHGTFASHLLFGITGSGKTEVYLQAIEAALQKGKSAIMLVPEISLTSQTIERFRSRFQQKIAVLHHKRSHGERSTAWDDLKQGKAKIVIGARSAIFCPIQNLGLIIVDEEHDSSYKQSEEPPCYHGRDVAVMRAHIEQCTIVLGSATPSIESRYNAEIGKYHFHVLRQRATHAWLPSIQIVDMKKTLDTAKRFTHFSDPLLDAIKKRVEAGEQTLLFLNRRGYHRLQCCASCRTVLKCPHCDLSLTYHKQANFLKCHLCNFTRPSPASCPACGASGTLEFKGFGTEHVERSLHAIFPHIRTLRMDRDTTQKKDAHEMLFKQFRSHKADVLIGTQMIAKGFHFPSVTLVGVLNADASLSLPDFRAPEHLFQLLTQVAGRAGRADLPGTVILQTFLPDHPLLHLAKAQDYEAFYQTTLAERKLFHYPPFTHLIKLLFTGVDPETTLEEAKKTYHHLSPLLQPHAELLPVAPAGYPKIKDEYRFQFLIKTKKISLVREALASLPPTVKVDVDPISTFF